MQNFKISEDSKFLISNNGFGTNLWDINGHQLELNQILSEQGKFYEQFIFLRGKRMILMSKNYELVAFDLDTNKVIMSLIFNIHTDKIIQVDSSNFIILSGIKEHFILINFRSMKITSHFYIPKPFSHRILKKGIFIGQRQGQILFHHLKSGKLIRKYCVHGIVYNLIQNIVILKSLQNLIGLNLSNMKVIFKIQVNALSVLESSHRLLVLTEQKLLMYDLKSTKLLGEQLLPIINRNYLEMCRQNKDLLLFYRNNFKY
ncbi:hypothetical protein pb186bvf_008722 [Paramecium bursaria]